MIPKTTIINILKSPWTWVVVVTLVLILVIYFKKINPFDFFTPPPDSNDVNLSAGENIVANQMAKDLHDEMKGLNLRRDLKPWRTFMQMSARMKRGTYQHFSTLYAGSNLGTLTQWVTDETSWSDPEGTASRQQVLDTLSQLGLS